VISIEQFSPSALAVSLEGTAKDIEERLLPKKPSYYIEIARTNPSASEFQIERSILNKWPRNEIGQLSKYGEPWRNHFLRFMRLLIPSTVITPSFMDEMFAIELSIATGEKIVNFIGHQNAGKSAIMARIALTMLAVDPEYSVAYLAAPYKNVAGYTIWTELTRGFRQIERHHKDAFPSLKEAKTENAIYFSDNSEGAGYIKLIGLDQVSKFQGTKAEDQTKGFFILIADEIGVFPSQAFLEVIDNVAGNDNFLGMTGCNYKSMIGMEGVLCDPRGKEYNDLDPDKDLIWLSAYNSITLRLDGHLCPNVLEKRVIYTYLLREERRIQIEATHTNKGAKYMEQVRSFPNTSSGEQYVLTSEQIRAGRAYDDFYSQFTNDWEKTAACDPGFGGDPCKIGGVEWGMANVQAHDGSSQLMNIIRPIGPIETIPVLSNEKITIEVLARINRFSRSPIAVREGDVFSKELQIALGCAEYLHKHNIPTRNFCFDASMRGEITRELVTVLGVDVVPYDTMNKPTEMVMDHEGKTAQDKYPNLRCETYFTTAAVITSGQFREAGRVQPALAQMCRHRVVAKGAKEALETKEKYKEMNQGKSPDDSDTLTMGIHHARRRGFQLAWNKKEAVAIYHNQVFDIYSISKRPSVGRLKS